VNVELLEALKDAQFVIGKIRIKEAIGTQPVWDKMKEAISNYEKQINK